MSTTSERLLPAAVLDLHQRGLAAMLDAKAPAKVMERVQGTLDLAAGGEGRRDLHPDRNARWPAVGDGRRG